MKFRPLYRCMTVGCDRTPCAALRQDYSVLDALAVKRIDSTHDERVNN